MADRRLLSTISKKFIIKVSSIQFLTDVRNYFFAPIFSGHLRGASPRIYDETYPMELCRIMPEQSVRREQMSQELSDALREVCLLLC